MANNLGIEHRRFNPNWLHTQANTQTEPNKWHFNSTFTQHFKQCVQAKVHVQNQNLYEICLDWTVSDNTAKGTRSYPKHVQWYTVRCACIFPLVFLTVWTGHQLWDLITKTIFTHKQSVPLSWLFVDSGKTSVWPQTLPVSLPYDRSRTLVKKSKHWFDGCTSSTAGGRGKKKAFNF